MPKLFQIFPGEGKLPNTEQYVAHNFLGYRFLNSAYMVTYRNSSVFKVFIIVAETPEKTDTVLEEYLLAVPKENVTRFGSDNFQIQDPHIGMARFQIFGRYICGTINCADRKIQDKYLKELMLRKKEQETSHSRGF